MGFSGTIRRAAAAVLPPSQVLALSAAKHRLTGEPELRWLDRWCDRERLAVDVGANVGIWSWYLRRHSRGVIAYEPNPDLAAWLRRALPTGVEVRASAVSDARGRLPLRIPLVGGRPDNALASLSQTFAGVGSVREVEVDVRRLDDEDLRGIGFLKVDVEGHERAVIGGAKELLKRERPTVVVEIEERHAPGAIEAVRAEMLLLGYGAYFVRAGALHDFAKFDRATMQNPKNAGHHAKYVNNFVFLPD